MRLLFSLIITGALLISSASAQDQKPQPLTTPAQHTKIEDNPAFKSLTPEQQKQILSIPEGPERDMAFAMLAVPYLKASPPPAVDYSYHGQSAEAAKAVPPPASIAVTVPCAPHKPSLLDKLKYRAELALAQQAQKADATIAKGTKGQVGGEATDAAVAAIQQANQPKPCVVQVPPKQ